MKILVATSNEGKMREIRACLEGTGIVLYSLKEKGIKADIDENGTTFTENALIKARTIHELTGMAVLADDSGFCIDAFDGGPGVYSARFMGEDTSYVIKNNHILNEVKGLPFEKRGAKYACSMACVLEDGAEIVTVGEVVGHISEEPKGSNGFGYDPIFFCDEAGCTFGELDPDKKNEISHRGRALQAMVKELLSLEK